MISLMISALPICIRRFFFSVACHHHRLHHHLLAACWLSLINTQTTVLSLSYRFIPTNSPHFPTMSSRIARQAYTLARSTVARPAVVARAARVVVAPRWSTVSAAKAFSTSSIRLGGGQSECTQRHNPCLFGSLLTPSPSRSCCTPALFDYALHS